MASLDESVHFLSENRPDEDPSEATSKRAGSQSVGPSSGRRRSLRQMAASFIHLIDEEEEEETRGNEGEASSPGGEERVVMDLVATPSSSMVDWGSFTLKTSNIDQLRREFYISNSMVIYTLGPDGRAPSPPANCLSFLAAQLRSGLRFSSSFFYCDVARLFEVPLNQLVPNSFTIMASFFMIFRFKEYPVSAHSFAQCFRLKRAELGFILFIPRPSVSFLPTPSPQKNWRKGIFFVFSSWPWGFPDQWIEGSPLSITVGRKPPHCLLFWRF
ncbi:UNVERIFIED_CONTAM: hypothetical protein Slati_3672200 [Sesamum latifolium]|uniref:Uncharacterized protein n=1 Tax=Sesamum latifolium TaxID=2727402 RepID=A0AAW2U0R9_9LAMI